MIVDGPLLEGLRDLFESVSGSGEMSTDFRSEAPKMTETKQRLFRPPDLTNRLVRREATPVRRTCVVA